MFLLYLSMVLIFGSILCLLRHKALLRKEKTNDYMAGVGILMSIGALLITISIIATMCSYYNQIRDTEELKKLDKYEQIYLSKSEALTEKFADFLFDAYPQHEKDIYNKIKPQDIDLYLVEYPELKASETITFLVNQIRDLKNDYYEQGLLRAVVVKRMAVRTKNPWIYYFLIK